MRVALYADAPVLLVGDIERGGVFAALYGTVALLPAEESALIRGFVINKFRGDPSLLDSGFEMLRERTGIATIGVLPYLDLTRLPAEDALEWDAIRHANATSAVLDVAVMRLPRVANLDEFQPLAGEPGVRLRFIGSAEELGTPDLIVIPGTKSTFADLAWLRERGLARAIHHARARGTPILGICGGFQMLGDRISDEDGVEASGEVNGLGLLPVTTSFAREKVTRRVTARVAAATALWAPEDALEPDAPDGATLGSRSLDAYEIHMGRTYDVAPDAGTRPFSMLVGEETMSDGLASEDGLVVGTYMHGLLEDPSLRRALLRRLAARKGVELPRVDEPLTVDELLDRLAADVREHLDLSAISAMIGIDAL
jgi:adenosylcobyric acid synthase